MAKRPQPDLPDRPVLIDGGMGRELQFRGVALSESIWSAQGLIDAPDVVRQIHRDYITVGADIITTNTYGLIRDDLAKAGIADRFAELNEKACALAREACDKAARPVLVAGSLPPLRGSFRPDLVGPKAENLTCYREQARLLAPHVDLLLCETMSSALEARTAAEAACETGRPVWVSWTLHEDESGRLRSGETIAQAVFMLADLPVSGFLTNCASPASITRAISKLSAATDQRVGGYANTFHPIPEDWRLDGQKTSDGLLPLRDDLGPDAYSVHAARWLDAGASVIGGCCGTRPAHIKKLRDLIMARYPE
ncbi:homocysteine S-methyltransferase [Desulfosarcina ovata subsp. sediminis]|uniref:Homocysteine S-methyltransferase n=1 Tax=Desulfosarcina ovata subsp. sediminis TaxID=885957 RepID=A0A5K7ZVA4_9BACT|nr:homocysteine S-methyltransferase family protein [Desulfosarcina ovata]BBO84130.1 homocysteine S-methyltransferase [Desulfosarcina ovata subsp. sediminis]